MYNDKMTEFDIKFNEKLFPNIPPDDYLSFYDTLTLEQQSALRKLHHWKNQSMICKKLFKFGLIFFPIFAAYFLFVLYIRPFSYEVYFHPSLYMQKNIVFFIPFIIAVIPVYKWTIKLASNFGIRSYSTQIGSHLEITYEGNGKARVDEVGDYVGMSGPIIWIINFFLWYFLSSCWIFYWMYISRSTNKTLSSKVSKDVFDAFEYAIDNSPRKYWEDYVDY